MAAAVEVLAEVRLSCLPQIIARRTALHPNVVAAKGKNEQLTYGELTNSANRIAGLLREARVQPGTVVAVRMDPSPQSLAAFLGIWKVGAAYLPVDPNCPPERLSFMLDDADAQFAIAGKAYAPSLLNSVTNLVLAEELGFNRGFSGPTDNDFPISPDSLAYVLYTSGSTGKPKGVEVCHGGLANVVTAIADELQLKLGEVLLGRSSPSFDVSNLEMYLPLVSGGSLYIADNAGTVDCARLIQSIAESGATTMLGTCTLWRLLLDAGWTGKSDLRVICGGEVLTLELAKALCHRSAGVWNQYGPTEATICSTTERVESAANKLTIGRPIANVTVHVLDAGLQPLADNAIGELYIGGAGVARGYRNRPELSAASFLPDPFNPLPGSRLYKTGDLARRLPDGRIEFVGRLDNQIKINGQRIELEEIEEQIRQYPGIGAVVVLALPREMGDKRLIAFVESKQLLSPSVIKEFLRARVPASMVPSEFRQIDSFPLNESGKVDRNLLKTRYAPSFTGKRQLSEPKNDIESRLSSIWENLLQTKPISLKDSFFDVGGDSLLAALLVTRIEQTFGQKISPDVLIDYPTVGSLAAHIKAAEQTVSRRTLVPLRRTGRQAPFFIVHGLGGSVLSFRELTAHLGEHRPVFGVALPEGPVRNRDEIEIKAFAAKCVDEIRRLFPSGPYHLGGHSFGALIAFEMAAQLSGTPGQVGILALLDSDLNIGRSKPGRSMSLAKAGGDLAATALRRYKLKIESLAENGIAEVVRRRFANMKLQRRVKLAQRAAQDESLHQTFDAKELLILAGARYYPPRYSGRSILFRATEEARSKADPTMGWADLVGTDLEIVNIPGKHMTILDSPHVATLAAELTERMNSVCNLS